MSIDYEDQFKRECEDCGRPIKVYPTDFDYGNLCQNCLGKMVRDRDDKNFNAFMSVDKNLRKLVELTERLIELQEGQRK